MRIRKNNIYCRGNLFRNTVCRIGFLFAITTIIYSHRGINGISSGFTIGIILGNRSVYAVHEQIVMVNSIRRNEPLPHRIIIPAPEVIQPNLLIVHIPTIAERIQRTNRRCQTAGFADRITSRIINIFYHLRAIRVNQRNHIALQIVDIEVINIIISNHAGLTLRIIEEMQVMAALSAVQPRFP